MKFVMTLVLMTPLLFAFGEQSAFAARIEPWNKQCLKETAAWKKQPTHRAIAVTKVYKNGQGCGHSWGWPTVSAAEQAAKRQCLKSLRKHRPKSKDGCIIVKAQ